MRSQNIVLFSSGISEQNGILAYVKEALEKQGYRCSYWRDLFSGANDTSNIALLPMLIKKIPTFDFAILICEGHDTTDISRNGSFEHVQTMRDNVLFEIGLCSMALGLNRVILLTDGSVRLPEDLQGKGGEQAIKVVSYDANEQGSYQDAASETIDYMASITDRVKDLQTMEQLVNDIDLHISGNIGKLYPTVIGASVSTANGYMTNFILRTLEKCDQGLVLDNSKEEEIFPDDKIFMHIILPMEYTPETPSRSREKMQSFEVGTCPHARFRQAEFRYRREGDELHIYDYPSTLVTGYATARIILSIDADDSRDPEAERRFNAKELDLFESALHALMCEQFIRGTVRHFYEDDTEEDEEKMAQRLLAMMDHIEIRREAY